MLLQVKALFYMVVRARDSGYTVDKMPDTAAFEIRVNERWTEELGGLLIGGAGPVDVPWSASCAALNDRRGVVRDALGSEHTFLPPKLQGIDVMFPLSGGSVKMSDWIVLAGPLGKFLLAGLLERDTQAVVFRYMDLVSSMWDKVISRERADCIAVEIKEVLALMELYLPAKELNMNRHMVIHLAEAIVRHGPPWAWSMFADERTWKWATDHLRNPNHKEASMMANLKVLQTAVTGVQNMPDTIGGVKASVPLKFETVDENGKLILPDYVLYREFVDVKLSHKIGDDRNLYELSKLEKYEWRVEVHRVFLRDPGLVKSCAHCLPRRRCSGRGCKSYADLWDAFLVHKRVPTDRCPRPAEWVSLLDEWREWASDQADLTPDQKHLCHGPHNNKASFFRNATINGVKFCTLDGCARVKGKPCVMMVRHDETEVSFGQVSDMMELYPPGAYPRKTADAEWKCSLVRLQWYKRGTGADLDLGSGLPVLKNNPQLKHPEGDLWNMLNVVPTNVGILPHWSNPNQVVVVHKDSTFMTKAF
jgi:hypothetical protein